MGNTSQRVQLFSYEKINSGDIMHKMVTIVNNCIVHLKIAEKVCLKCSHTHTHSQRLLREIMEVLTDFSMVIIS